MNNFCQCGCGKEVIKVSNKFLHGHNKSTKGYKWSEESRLKSKKSALSKEVQEKKRLGCLRNLGVENPFQSELIKQKYRQTSLENWGVKHPFQSKDVKEKIRKKHLENFGAENPNQSEKIKEKIKKTCLKLLGVEHPLQSQKVREKYKKTCLERLGVEHPFQSKDVREKSQQTCLQKLGVVYPFQSEEVRQKSQQTCLQKYGKEYYTQTPESRKVARETIIKRLETQKLNGEQLCPRVGTIERECLNELQKLIPYQIIRQQPITGYYPDGYIKELNLIIEFDEPIHYVNNMLTERDQSRQQELINHLNCKFFRIKESDWLENPNNIKQKFVELIKTLSEEAKSGK